MFEFAKTAGREIYLLLSRGWAFAGILKIENMYTNIEVVYQSNSESV